jgi:hypothetical protein
MRMKCTAVLGCAIALIAIHSSAIAQRGGDAPSGQFGIGMYLQAYSLPYGGLTLEYAITKNIHVGTLFGFSSTSYGGAPAGTTAPSSQTSFGFSPYFMFVMDGPVSPFFHGGIGIASLPLSGGTSGTFMNFVLGGGIVHYWGGAFGVHADIDFLSLGLSAPSNYLTTTIIGFNQTRLGVLWFMGR